MNLDQARLNNIYEEIVEIIRKELCGSSGVGDLAELLHNEFSNAGSFFFFLGGEAIFELFGILFNLFRSIFPE